MEQAQRIKDPNQARGPEKGKNKEAPVVEKDLKGEAVAVGAPVAAAERAEARGPENKMLRINKIKINH